MNTQTEKLINGEPHTRHSIIEKHVRLVHMQCHKLKRFAKSVGQEYEDIVSEGHIGLIKAYDRFDGDKYDVRFSTYAVPYIYGTIQQFLYKQNVGFKYPAPAKRLGWKIARLDMTDKDAETIALELDEEVDSVNRALGFLRNSRPTSLNSTAHETESDLNDIIGEDVDYTKTHVEEYLKVLDKRERFIVKELLRGKSQSEISLLIGVSQAHTSRLIKRIRIKYQSYEKGVI